MKTQRQALISWFTHSVCLSVCRWYAVEGVSLISRSVASSLEKLDTKALPLSLMTASGSPWCLQTCSRKRCATPVESTVVTVGMAWMRLDSLSTTTRMALYPLDSDSSLMVSTEITSQQQVGIQFGVSFCVRRTCSGCRHRTLPHSWQHSRRCLATSNCRRPAPVSSTTLGGQSSWSHGGHGQCHGGAGGLLGHTRIPCT